jgi:hypothetical protein
MGVAVTGERPRLQNTDFKFGGFHAGDYVKVAFWGDTLRLRYRAQTVNTM